MQCEDLADRLSELIDGELDEVTEAAAIEHLASCEACVQVLGETRSAIELVRANGRPELTTDMRVQLWRRIEVESRRC